MSLREILARWLGGLLPARTLGERGERLAARYLNRLGYKILARHASGKLGELDLVALDGQTIVFVEVKTRQSLQHGHPAEAVDFQKQRRLTRAALGYLRRYGLLEQPARFDVVAITWPQGEKPHVQHIKNAFEAAGFDGFYS